MVPHLVTQLWYEIPLNIYFPELIKNEAKNQLKWDFFRLKRLFMVQKDTFKQLLVH